MFLKFFHVDELDHLLIECHRKATTLQKIVRGFRARLAHRALLEKAKVQQAEAKHFLTRGCELVERYVVIMRNMTEFDLKMRFGTLALPGWSCLALLACLPALAYTCVLILALLGPDPRLPFPVDKAMQEEQERRRQANKVLRKQEEVMEREREAKAAETERVREELNAAQAAHQLLRNQLSTLVEEKTYSEQKSAEQARLVADLENRLRLRESELKRQLDEQKRLFSGMKQELHEKEADLNTQVVERESIIREVMR